VPGISVAWCAMSIMEPGGGQSIMGTSPELFREVDGSRIAAVSVSSEALRRQRSCALATVCHQTVACCHQTVACRLASMNNLVQNHAVTGIWCPCSAVELVRVNIENRIDEFCSAIFENA
jgi:hypothetical protein